MTGNVGLQGIMLAKSYVHFERLSVCTGATACQLIGTKVVN
jgi:hypothetical protein